MQTRVVYNGTPLLGLLGILFIALKLMGYITWSWWWVLAPFWIGFAFVAAIFAVFGIIFLIALAGGGLR